MTESVAPVQQAAPEPREDDDERPALQITRRNLITLAAFLAASIAALYFLLPQFAGLEDTWARINDGRPLWIIAALLFTVGMFAGYGAWLLVVNARAYCDAGYEAGDRFGFLYVELPVSVIGYGLCALVMHAVGWWLHRREEAPQAIAASAGLEIAWPGDPLPELEPNDRPRGCCEPIA